MTSSRTALGLAATIVLTSACRLQAEAVASTSADDKPTLSPVKAPATPAEIETRRAALAEQTQAGASLSTATQPASTQPISTPTQPADVATNLWFLLRDYDKLLAILRTQHGELARLKCDESNTNLQREIAEYRSRTAELTRKLGSDSTLRDQVDTLPQVSELYEKLNQEHNTEVEAQTARVRRLGEFAKLREKANAKVADATKQHRKVVAELKDRATTAEAAETAKAIRWDVQLSETKLEMALAEVEALGVEEECLALRQQYEDRRLKTLQPYVKTLRLWMNALEKAQAADREAWIDVNIKAAKTRAEKLYWGAAKLIHQAYLRFEAYDDATRSRFPESEFGRLENAIARAKTYWENFLDSVKRRSGQEVLKRYKQIRGDLKAARDYESTLVKRLDTSIDEREALYLYRDQVLEEIGTAEEELGDAIATAKNDQGTKLLSDLTKDRLALIKQMDSMSSLQNALVERLTKAVKQQRAHADSLDRTRSRLYWSYLKVRDQGLVDLDVGRIRSEWAKDAPAMRKKLGAVNERGIRAFRQASPRQWTVVLLLFGVSVPLAWVVRRRLTNRVTRFEDALVKRIRNEGVEGTGISDRLQIAAVRLVGETALAIGPAAALLAGLFILDFDGLMLHLASAALAGLILICLSLGLIRAMFLRARPRFRVVSCSNKVATYYRRWLRVFIGLSVVLVPVPFLLYLLDAMVVLRVQLWQVYTAGSLLLGLLFLLRKRLVLKVVGREEDLRIRWLFSLVAAVYPLIVVGTLALLVLVVMGYGPLASYVIRNTLLTFVALVGVTTLTRSSADLARKYKRRFERERQGHEVADAGPGDADHPSVSGATQSAGPPDQTEIGEAEFFVSLAALVFGWLVRLVGLVLILGVWGITLVEIQSALTYPLAGSGDQTVTLWRVLAAVIAVVLAVVLSRFLRSVLTNRVYPAYEALDRGARAAINTLLHYFLVVLGIYAAVQVLHANLGALTVLVGTLGLGLGLGLQPLFINFISGLMIFLERHIKVGDIVEAVDKIGEVTRISMRSTSIKTFDNIDMIIPNAEFITNQVVNWSLQDRRIRGQLNIGVAYGSNVELVRDLLLKAAHEHPHVLRDPEPVVWFTDFGDSALTFRLLVHFGDLSDRMSSLTELRFAIDKAFAEHGINIPFPQRTLSMIGDRPLRVELTPSRSDTPEPIAPTEPDDGPASPPTAPPTSPDVGPPNDSGSA